MTLLEKALKIEENNLIGRPINGATKDLREKCELMLAYRDGKVYATQVAEVLKIKSNQVSALCWNILAMGVRHGICKIEMIPEEPKI